MGWNNQAITVFHGTDNLSATSIRLYGIDPSKFRARTDFGAGFYVTSVLHQAEQWANRRCRRLGITSTAEVLQFDISRATIERLRHLTFVVDDSDYHDFVDYCRGGALNHGPRRGRRLTRSCTASCLCGRKGSFLQPAIKSCSAIPARWRILTIRRGRCLLHMVRGSFEAARMTQVSAKDLDFSAEMRDYFASVQCLLVQQHDKSPDEARRLVDRYFSLDVDPLERALVMHDDAAVVAADLSRAKD